MTTPKPKNPAAQALGRLGGGANTPAQTKARQAAAKLAGRPRRICTACGEPMYGGHKHRAQDRRCTGQSWTWQKMTEKRAAAKAKKNVAKVLLTPAMSDATIIAWTEHTWNPWRGCDKISPGCAHCYMFTAQRRYGRDPEVVVRTTTWSDPAKWERAAAAAHRRALVFTCSWSDWFHEAADAWRPEAWAIVKGCPHLHFQILTKRHERIRDHLPPDWGAGYPNVWLGVSIENDKFVQRADTLRTIPAVVRFISAEPLLGPLPSLSLEGIDWLIVGGESGAGYRPMQLDWVRALRTMARLWRTAFFFKQSAALLTEKGIYLDGAIVREYPTPRIVHPSKPRLF